MKNKIEMVELESIQEKKDIVGLVDLKTARIASLIYFTLGLIIGWWLF